MPSTTSSEVSMVFDSSTVITPSLPTLFIASAMMLPIVESPFAETVPTWAIASPLTGFAKRLISSIARSTALSMPRLSAMGFAPAATVFTPSRKIAWASTVAVVGNGGRTKFLVDNHVTALWTQRDLNRVGELINSAQDSSARLLAMNYLL